MAQPNLHCGSASVSRRSFPPRVAGMQRYPSITRDYRAGGSGAAPAGGSYRGIKTAGEVPQWLVDTCNEDNEYDEEYEYQKQDDYRDNSSHMLHYHQQHEAACRKSSLDTLETFRADNTTTGTSSRQRQLHYNDDYSSNFEYTDSGADDGSRNPYMFESYEEQVEDYYPEGDVQFSYAHDQNRMNDYREEQQPQVPPRQSFKEYQRYVMEQQQYLPPNKSGRGSGVGRGILGAVGGFLNDRVMALQKQGQSTSNLTGSLAGPKPTMPPRQSSMRHRDGSLRGGRYQQQQQSQHQMTFQGETPTARSQQQPMEEPPPISKQEELMMMELSGDAVPIRGGGGNQRGIQRQRSQRPASRPAQWDASNSGSRFASSRSSVHSSESSISSLSSRRALRYHDPEYKPEEDEEEEYVDTNGQELICGWGHENEVEAEDIGRYTAGAGSYDMRPPPPPPRTSHPRYQRQQYYSSGDTTIRNQSHQQMYEQEEPEAYESFQDMLPRREGGSHKDKLVGMVKKQVNFRSPEFSRPPLVPNGRGRPAHYEPDPMPRYQAEDPPGRNELPRRREEPAEQVPAHSHIQTIKRQLLQQSRNNNSLTSLTNYEIDAKTEDGGQPGTGGKERRFSDVTFEPMLEQLLNLNGSKSSLTSSLNDSGSLNADQIASLS